MSGLNALTLVMMAGPPGSGKSTLADGLASSFGRRIFRFAEERLFDLAEFYDVADAFRTRTFPDTPMMLNAYRTLFERIRRNFDTVVFDWGCVGMIEDLPCAQPDRASVTTFRPEMRADQHVLAGHAADVRALAEASVLLVLDVPITTAIERAYAQRGSAWFDPWSDVASLRGGDSLLSDAVRYWEAGAHRAHDCVRAHVAAGWDVVHLDASAPISELLAQAMTALAPYMIRRRS